MKRRFSVILMSFVLGGSILFSSCIGTFSLTNKLLDWNKNLSDKFVNELVFIVLNIVPVYPVAITIDALVTNSIEFWTGDNPVSDVRTKQVKGNDGLYTIKTDKSGHKVTKESTGETVYFHFDGKEKTWSVEANGQSATLLKVLNSNEVAMYLPDGSSMLVPLNEAGVVAFKEVIDNKAFYALK
jgi:hypothetical protein